MKWQLVPEKPTPEMVDAGVKAFQQNYNSEDVCEDWRCCYKAMLAASPQPEHDRMTKEEAQAMQDWKGMDGAIAFHLIERHADGWHQVGEMMNAWLRANSRKIDKESWAQICDQFDAENPHIGQAAEVAKLLRSNVELRG